MDSEKFRRNQIDYHNDNQVLRLEQDWEKESNQISIQQSYQSFSLTKETSVLSVQQNNQINLNLKEIIALNQKIDNKIFDHQLSDNIIIAEKTHFSNIQEVENQRILLQSNPNSTIIQAFLGSNNKLIVTKYFSIENQEMLIKKMDEYIIHHKVNELYPEQSIELILPVRILKDKQLEMTSCIERAEINLYDYSQNQQISQEEAEIIFQQLLQQIINLHKIKIAHRDIKPQNILYVKEKGWLISDFGESLEYFEVDDVYDVRGTVYFLRSNIQKQVKIGK